MKIAICEDLTSEREILLEYLRRFEQEEHVEARIAEYASAESLLSACQRGVQIDILFLDIYMDQINGMDAAKILVDGNFDGFIVFTTTSKDFAVDSYQVNAEGYLVKPYSYESFCRTMERCREKWAKVRKSVRFVSERIEYTIFLKDIEYIETEFRCCMVHTKNGELKTNKPISEFAAELENEFSFLRIGKSYLVNLNNMKKTDEEFLYFSAGQKVALPVRDKAKIKKQIAGYFWRLTRE